MPPTADQTLKRPRHRHGRPPIVLGIETSCDETGVAVVAADRVILSNQLLSQVDAHAAYGGIVPEIAARAHIDHLDRLIATALMEATESIADLDAIAVTAGPGLIGGLLVGTMTAKALAWAADRPVIAINHLEGHALSPRLVDDIAFPYLLLLVSGGHCQLQVVEGVGRYRRLGTTVDDAAGEAFDKTAKILGLGYPGGPAVEQAARDGRPDRFALPRPLTAAPGCDFSFSGLKTAVLRAARDVAGPDGTVSDTDRADLAASFQAAIGDCLVDRAATAMTVFTDLTGTDTPPRLVVAGGVAANGYLRSRLEQLCLEQGFTLTAPPQWLCTDNAAMIAWAGVERLAAGLLGPEEVTARARWPLDETATPAVGGGKKGVKV